MRLFARGGPALPPLTALPRVADLPEPILRDGCRYLGTLAGARRVRSRGLGSASSARIQLSGEGVDVVRLAGSFRIPATALRSARDEPGFAGRAGEALVIRWEHGEQVLDTGFRLQSPGGGGTNEKADLRRWTRSVEKVGRRTRG
jgi:hypothetical protein